MEQQARGSVLCRTLRPPEHQLGLAFAIGPQSEVIRAIMPEHSPCLLHDLRRRTHLLAAASCSSITSFSSSDSPTMSPNLGPDPSNNC